MSSTPFLPILQVYRGVAAMMVVFHHLWNSFSHFYDLDNFFLSFFASIGKFGVDFFFVLSGFIISYSNFEQKGRRRMICPYLVKRAIRVFVPYWPIGITMLLAYYIFPEFSQSNRDVSIVTSIFLVPYGAPALSVAWTLIHELMFYLLFSIWFLSSFRFNLFLIVWLFSILFYNYCLDLFGSFDNIFFKYFLSVYNIEFMLGYIASIIVLNFGSRFSKISFYFFVLLFAVFSVLMWKGVRDFEGLLNYLFSIACFFGILASLNVNFNKRRNLLLVLGNASFSIYLIHNPLISILSRVSYIVGVGRYFYLAIGFVICLIFGWFYYFLIERKILSRLKRSLPK